MKNERERAKRAYVRLPVKIGGLIKAVALDLSLEGIFVATDSQVARGDEIILTIDVDEIHLELYARVLFTIDGWGFGAQFLHRTPEQIQMLEVLMVKQQVDKEKHKESAKPTILIIDDSDHYWKMKLLKLKQLFNVIKVEDGEQGLNILKETQVDLVISELKNRRADVFRILQFMDLHPEIRSSLVVLTNFYQPADRTLLKQRGAIGFFDKLKMSQDKLIAKINEILIAY
jgi:CheY-like chemotaxis protein